MPARATPKSKAPKAAKAPAGTQAAKKAPAKPAKAVKKPPAKPAKPATPAKSVKAAPAARKPAAKNSVKATTPAKKAVKPGRAAPVVKKPAAKTPTPPSSAAKPAARPVAAKAAAPSKPSVAKTRAAAAVPGTSAANSHKTVTQTRSSTPAVAAPPTPAPKKKRKPIPPGPLTEETIREMDEDDYMNEAQLSFFRERLLQMRQEVLVREVDVKERLHQREVFADPADRATAEEEHWLDLRLRERESLLLRKIDEALKRIADREYGYCEKTGDPIGIPRLLARPTATVCVDIKGQDERVEAQYRDR